MNLTPYDLTLLRRAKIAAPEPRLCIGCAHQATTQLLDGEPVCERCAPPMTLPMAQRLAELDQANWMQMDRDRWKRRARFNGAVAFAAIAAWVIWWAVAFGALWGWL